MPCSVPPSSFRALACGLLLATIPHLAARAQNVGIGTTAPDASAALDIVSSTRGVLLPRVAAATALASPATGLLVFQTGAPTGFYFNAGTPAVPSWQLLVPSGSGSFVRNQTGPQAGASFNVAGSGTVGGTLTAANVGIGTSTPDRPLTVQAAPGLVELLSLRDNTGATRWHWNLAGGGLNLAQSGVADNRIYVSAAGNVGLGTDVPSAVLDVNGTARLRGLTVAGVVTTDAAGNLGSAPAAAGADNLGNHTATQTLALGANALTGTGTSIGTAVGVGVRADGGLNLGQNGVGNNLLLGFEAGQTLAPSVAANQGVYNQFVGYQSGFRTTRGRRNQFVGYQSGFNNIQGEDNTFSGYQSGTANTSGNFNVFSGLESGLANSTGSFNVFIGCQSSRNSNGSNNVFIGYRSGRFDTGGDNNTALGYFAGPTTANLTNAAAIGYLAVVSQSNSLVLGGLGANGVNVGIGTSAPGVALHVVARNRPSTNGLFSYFFPTSTGLGTVNNNLPPANDVAGYFVGQLWATNAVSCGLLTVTSDARLKTVVGRSDRAADLALLNQLRITDYTMRDQAAYGPRRFKKVIAQEVEAVYPQAVSQRQGFVPDLYQLAQLTAAPGDSLLRLALPVPAGGVVSGQRLKLVLPTGAEVLAQVARAAAAGESGLVLRRTDGLTAGPVFAYGLEQADVRAVDYEALAMLNVSATQELARKVAALETAAAQAATDHADLQTLKQQLARLLGENPPAEAQARR